MKRFLLQFEALVCRAVHALLWLSGVGVVGFLWLVSPLLALGILAGILYVNRPQSGVSAAHGSASWASFRNLRKAGCVGADQGVFLGRAIGLLRPRLIETLWAIFCYAPWNSRDAQELILSRKENYEPTVRLSDQGPPHLAVYAASGMGKSTAFAIPTLLDWAHGVIALDAKGELFKKTAALRARKFGQEIVSIDPFGIAGQHEFGRGQLNVLSLYRGLDRTLADEARRLANALVIRTGEEKEPFWNDSSQVLIQTVLLFLLWNKVDAKEANLNRLRDILTNPKVMEELLEFMRGSDECYGFFKRLAGQVGFYQGQTQASIYSVANTQFEFLDSAPIADVVQATNFEPRKVLDGQMSIYLSLPIDRIEEMAGLQRIILTSLINLIFQAGENRERRILFLLDEAATLGQIDALYRAVNYGRSFGIKCMFLYQSVSQVEIGFPKSKAADFRGTVASCFAGVNDLATAKEVSDWIGQTTVENVSKQSSFSWGKSQNNSLQDTSQGSSDNSSTSTTRSESGRALIQPEEVLQLPKWAAILLLPGTRPTLLRKVPYFQRKRKLWKFFLRSCRTVFHLALLTVWGTLLWAVTAGQDHLQVQQIVSDYQTWTHNLRSGNW